MEMRACIMLAMLLFTAALRLIFAVQNSPTQGGSFSLASAGRCGDLPYPRTIRRRNIAVTPTTHGQRDFPHGSWCNRLLT
jgi:hypothetical protein